MRKLNQEAEWVTQGHVNQSAAWEHTPFQFWHLCSFWHSAWNPSVGIWKKWFFLPLKRMFCWLLEVVPSLSVFLFFLCFLPVLVILFIKLSQLLFRNWHISFTSSKKQLAKEIIHSPGSSLSISDWLQHWQRPGAQKHRGHLMTFKEGGVPPQSLREAFLSNTQICFQLHMQRCDRGK